MLVCWTLPHQRVWCINWPLQRLQSGDDRRRLHGGKWSTYCLWSPCSGDVSSCSWTSGLRQTARDSTLAGGEIATSHRAALRCVNTSYTVYQKRHNLFLYNICEVQNSFIWSSLYCFPLRWVVLKTAIGCDIIAISISGEQHYKNFCTRLLSVSTHASSVSRHWSVAPFTTFCSYSACLSKPSP